jgi:myo-inositol-1(or 4)-monophosphatase
MTTSHHDYSPYAATARRLIDMAYGYVSEHVIEGQTRTSSRKADGSLVTETDKALNDLIERQILEAHPDHAVLSEERGTTYDPSRRFTWIVDPLDGTTNFARGLPIWGICAALCDEGRPVVAAVGFPLLDETYFAVRGSGATCNGLPLRVPPVGEADDENFIMCCTRTARAFEIGSPLKPRILGSAAFHIIKVADGTALASLDTTPRLWDLAAPLLILTEAGGVYTPLGDETPFPVAPSSTDYRDLSFPILCAANAPLLAATRATVQRRSDRNL